MQSIYSKTLQDLEFPTVLEQLSARCNTELGKEAALKLEPLTDKESLLQQLGQTSEYLASFTNENRIPNHGFDAITKELKLLHIENNRTSPITNGITTDSDQKLSCATVVHLEHEFPIGFGWIDDACDLPLGAVLKDEASGDYQTIAGLYRSFVITAGINRQLTGNHCTLGQLSSIQEIILRPIESCTPVKGKLEITLFLLPSHLGHRAGCNPGGLPAGVFVHVVLHARQSERRFYRSGLTHPFVNRHLYPIIEKEGILQ